MDNFSRRNFGATLLQSFFAYALVETLSAGQLLAKPVASIFEPWVREVENATGAMKKQKLSPGLWQQKIAEIFSQVEQKDLLRAIDFERLSKKIRLFGTHEAVLETKLPPLVGLPDELSFSTFIYGMKKGGAIPPHCHSNMTSMHMPLRGELHGWHFNRIADETEHLIIQPTMDKQLSLGEVTTISDEKDNVHWFEALSPVAYTFNIGVYGISPAQKFGGRQFYLDAAHGEKIENNQWRVKKLNTTDAYKIYSKL